MLEKVGLLFKIDLGAESSAVHGRVLAQWPKMFQILSQFRKSDLYTDEGLALTLETVLVRDSSDAERLSLPTEEGQRLVRIPIDELQQANADKE